MKIIFCDIDGVLNNRNSLANGVHLLPEKVLILNRLCERSGAQVVVSSSWRILYGVKTLQALLYRAGLNRAVVKDVTPDMGGIRGDDVAAWLRDRDDIESYVIVDDDDDFHDDQLDRFIKTRFDVGLTEVLAHRMHDVLMRPLIWKQ